MTTSSSSTVRSVRRRHLFRWRRRAAALQLRRRVAALLSTTAVFLVATAGSAHADASDALRVAAQLGPGHGPAAVLLRLVLLVATAFTAGAGLAAAVSRDRPARRLSVLAWAAAVVVAVGAEVTHLIGASTMTGTIVAALTALAVPVLLASRWVVAPTVATTLLLAVGLASAHSGGAFALDAVYAVGAVVLLGLSILGVTTGPAAGPTSAAGPRSAAAPAGRVRRDHDGHGAPRDRAAVPSRAGVPARPDRAGAPRAARRSTELPVVVGVRRGVADPAVDGGPTATGTARRSGTATLRRAESRADVRAHVRTDTRADVRADLAAATRRRPARRPVAAPAAPAAPVAPDATGTRRADRRARPRLPVRRIAIAAGAVTTLAGLLQLVVSGPATLDDVVATPYGLVALAGVLLPAVATVLWVVTGSRGGRARAVELQRFAVVATASGLAAVAALAALPIPAPGVTPGEPLLRAVDLGGTQLAVLVAPMRPGPNLVQVSGSSYPAEGTTVATPQVEKGHHGGAPAGPAGLTVDAGSGPVTVTTRDGATGGWAVVDIPAGTERLTLRAGPADASVPVDVGTMAGAPTALAGTDGPECASALLGTFVARTAAGAEAPMPACPSDVLAAGDAVSLRAMTNFVGEHGVAAIRLVSDDSPRSQAAAGVVRDEAARHQVRLVDGPGADVALVVVGGWAQAADTLRTATLLAGEEPTYLGGTFLAPWLLTPSVVTQAQSSVLPLEFSPQDAGPQQYAATLAATFPGAAPSASGYLAWVAATRSLTDDRPRLYGAAPVDVPMMSGPGDMADMGHGAVNPAAWFPGGTVVPVTGPLAGT
ncbi:hypothetical protein [Pseudonocardia sp.]|uniref:hypothetical protein n=1 Tax=Pseudonocardia sp. TaxID=60912 RepID=UPI003D09FCE4